MITLENKKIRIIVSPEMGMALVDFAVYNRNILNKDMQDDFLKFRKGLGPIILPHFNQDSPTTFENVDLNDEKYRMFSHIQYLRELGILHPFQHGIGRYVAWNYKVKDNAITGTISGDDKINNVSLKDLNGFDFNSKVTYKLFQNYLDIVLEISGEMPVASGIHFYYDSVDEKSMIFLNAYNNEDIISMISLNENHNNVLKPIAGEYGFFHCLLQTSRYNLVTKFMVEGKSSKAFESLIVFSNTDKRFVCIEPISYQIGTKNTKLRHCGEIQLIPNI